MSEGLKVTFQVNNFMKNCVFMIFKIGQRMCYKDFAIKYYMTLDDLRGHLQVMKNLCLHDVDILEKCLKA